MKQGPIRMRDAVSTAQPSTSRVPSQLAVAVSRLAAEDPERARLFLRYLNRARRTGRRHTVLRVLRAFGLLGGVVAEAARPTPLVTRPASLSESWSTVGRLLDSSMREFDAHRDQHVG